MGSVSATPASSTSNASAPAPSASTATQSFTGLSTYSSDFQAILAREDAISQLPITALQNKEDDNLSQKQALVTLNPIVASVAADVGTLGTLAAGGALTASSSDSSTISVQNTGATAPANYTISNITMATAASETSLQSYTNATSAPVWVPGQTNFKLTVGSAPAYTLDLTGNDNLNGLADAINSSGAPVNASIINTGSASYLTLSANNVGATTLTLTGVPTAASLITDNGTGTETSLSGYASATTTPVSTSGTVDLTVGSGSAIQLNITGNNNLTGLMNAINSAASGVTASINTTGGQNFLQVVAAGGATPITLADTPGANPVNLISGTNQGGNASFTLNGTIPVTNQPTNTFTTVIPGLSFTLNQNDTGSVNLSLSTDSTQLTSALQQFTTDYNSLVDQVNQQTGTGAGPLGGDSIISDISSDLQQLTSYIGSSTSTVRSLSDLGVTFSDNTGQLSFDPTVVQGFSSTQLSDAFKFLGSSNSGFASFASNFTQISDPIEGFIEDEENGLDTDNTQIQSQITTLQQQATIVHNNNAAQLEAADALVAQLQSNQNTINAEVQSIDYVDFGQVVNQNSA